MSTKAQDDFNKLVGKSLEVMAVSRGLPKDILQLAMQGIKESKKGYDFFIKWIKSLPYDDRNIIAGEIQHFSRQRKRTIEKMLQIRFEQKELRDFKEITEAKGRGATFTFGRFNPPTVGHMKLAAKMKSISSGHDVLIYTTHTTDKKKNPLTNKQIRKYMNPMLPRGINVQPSPSRTVFEVVVDLYNKGYRNVQMVVGSDRIKEFETLLNKYNGVKGKRHGYYNFESIKVVSAGDRDPDAEGTAGMSASKMRHLAYSDQEDEFIKALPRGYKFGPQLYKAVRVGMGIREDFPDFMYETYTDTHVPQVHEWGSQEGREYAQAFTPYEPVVNWRKLLKREASEDLPKKVLLYKEKMYKELKSERDDFKRRYGERADEVMHATAMTMAKRKYGYT